MAKIELREPTILFHSNLDSEKEVFLSFWRSGQSLHPNLNHLLGQQNEEEVKGAISCFIDEYYHKNRVRLRENFDTIIKEWYQVRSSYYKKVGGLLNNYPWPSGDYLACGSILYLFPRNIAKRWFTFPLSRRFNAVQVIAHEMLHFIVYDYLEKVFGLKPSEGCDQDNKFWQFSENLNALIEDEPIWQEFMRGNKANIKPECKTLYLEMKAVWDKDKSIDHLIESIF